MNHTLDSILARPDVWQASRVPAPGHGVSTGHGALDARLHHGGWPRSALTELLCDGHGLGEWQLLWPALLAATGSEGLCLLVAPPFIPFPPGLAGAGLPCDRLLVVESGQPLETTWCVEQALKARACEAVVAWFGSQRLEAAQLRRLQLAARGSGSLVFLYRHSRYASQHSPASLRLAIRRQVATGPANTIALDILKQAGGWAGQGVLLRREQPWLQSALAPDQLPVHIRAGEHDETTVPTPAGDRPDRGEATRPDQWPA